MSAPERINLSSPDVGDLEEAALSRAFHSGWIAPLGPDVDAFEAELATFCERQHCVSLSSGTAALHLGLLALGVGPGDLVLTSSMTFAATANAIAYTGAEPVFIDSDESGNMDPALLRQAISQLSAEGLTVKLILPVDLLGKTAAHEQIDAIAEEYGVPVLSDAAESLGATRDGFPAASYGVISAVSFNGNKIMTTSGGGALLTDNKAIADRVRYLATQARQPVPWYEHRDVGYNYRMSNLLASMGRAQLSRLPAMMERRRQHRLMYIDFFEDIPGVTVFGEPSGSVEGQEVLTHDNWWLSTILVDSSTAGFTPEELRLALANENIEARPLWKPMHLQPIYSGKRAFVNGASEQLFTTGLSLPSGSVLTDSDMDRVIGRLSDFLSRHTDG